MLGLKKAETNKLKDGQTDGQTDKDEALWIDVRSRHSKFFIKETKRNDNELKKIDTKNNLKTGFLSRNMDFNISQYIAKIQ